MAHTIFPKIYPPTTTPMEKIQGEGHVILFILRLSKSRETGKDSLQQSFPETTLKSSRKEQALCSQGAN